jgi:hypothetical protein
MQSSTVAKTARHFDEGARVFHKEHGDGIVRVSPYTGEKYPYFESTKTTGTPMTRLYPADEQQTVDVVVCGPNLRDQSKGSFHVHAAGCADLTRSATREPEYANGWALTVGTRLDVAGEVYADMIDESGDDAASYVDDFHFFPCCDALPHGGTEA